MVKLKNKMTDKKLQIIKNIVLKKYEDDFTFEMCDIIHDKLHIAFSLKNDEKNAYVIIINTEMNFKEIDEDFKKYKLKKVETVDCCDICFEETKETKEINLTCNKCNKSICEKCFVKLCMSFYDSVDIKGKKWIMKNKLYVFKCPYCRQTLQIDKNALDEYRISCNNSQ